MEDSRVSVQFACLLEQAQQMRNDVAVGAYAAEK